MTEALASRRRTRKWHIGDKATIDHLVAASSPIRPRAEGRTLQAVTDSGLLVQDQVRKAWDRTIVGLAIF
jgi:hypothetical protein